MKKELIIIGGGLAGSEAAWQAAVRGIKVLLYEMRPFSNTPAHKTDKLGELICSNSLKSNSLEKASGLLKEELRCMGSKLMETADRSSLPAGSALAVDRDIFASKVTESISSHENISLIRKEISVLQKDIPTIIATGPLTSKKLAENIINITGEQNLYFYDAIAPIVDSDSIDYNYTFKGSRYSRTNSDYINCTLSKEEYDLFYQALINADKAPLHSFEKNLFFEACLPIEEMASRGNKTLLYGPMRPVGLTDPKTNKRPFAIIQLRQEDLEKRAYGLVGFQTRLKYSEQKRVFSLIPALKNAAFLQYGSMHRNTYINSPEILTGRLQLSTSPNIMFAGQITGAEGYIESIATGFAAGVISAYLIKGETPPDFPDFSPLGVLLEYITSSDPKRFHPMHINFSLFPIPNSSLLIKNKKERRALLINEILKGLSQNSCKMRI